MVAEGRERGEGGGDGVRRGGRLCEDGRTGR